MSRTFRDLSEEEIKKYREALVKREKERKKAVERRFHKAWDLVRKMSKILHEKYHAKEVIVFGSMIDLSCFNEWSDIDIAIVGIPDDLYFKAVAEILSMSEDFDIDIVDVESCSESLKKVIMEKGIRI
ncbi:MAG: DNA polymerase subunit beta [Dictyoglomus sp. NZ13-RE01]|nr:MAG: DNA polymerase subunit beta [Dictyoglomus sp. NZ13-RE01]